MDGWKQSSQVHQEFPRRQLHDHAGQLSLPYSWSRTISIKARTLHCLLLSFQSQDLGEKGTGKAAPISFTFPGRSSQWISLAVAKVAHCVVSSRHSKGIAERCLALGEGCVWLGTRGLKPNKKNPSRSLSLKERTLKVESIKFPEPQAGYVVL